MSPRGSSGRRQQGSDEPQKTEVQIEQEDRITVSTEPETGKVVETQTTGRTGRVVGPEGELDEELAQAREFVSELSPGGGGAGPRRRGRDGVSSVAVHLGRSNLMGTDDAPLWWAIERSTDRLSFNNYLASMDALLCGTPPPGGAGRLRDVYERLRRRRYLPFTDTDAYRLLKVATEAFVSVNCAVVPLDGEDGEWKWWEDPEIEGVFEGKDITYDLRQIGKGWYDIYLQQINGTDDHVLPYLALIRRKLAESSIKSAIFYDDGQYPGEERCYGILRDKLTRPCLIELIWSYWHEQGMLVQTMNAISQRFQNIRGPADRDPLAMMEVDPLRPLNNLLWGYIQDEQHRLSLLRRVYEYDHHYGLTLEGKAVPPLRTADSRSKFLDSFHNLLYLCTTFYKQDDDTTVIADPFPILIALRDVHMQLVEGAHNQFGDLPSTARIEMLMQQWLLARPEFLMVLPTRIMVDYPEPWMDRVDAMKRLQDWPGNNVMHFHDLGRYGEQILLTIRFGDWNNAVPDQAKVWARYWRTQIQSYIQSYRIVAGVDLTADVTQPQQRSLIATQPSVLLRRQLTSVQPPAKLPPPPPAPAGARFRERRALRNP